jgi:hypothetical protein
MPQPLRTAGIPSKNHHGEYKERILEARSDTKNISGIDLQSREVVGLGPVSRCTPMTSRPKRTSKKV